MGEVFKPEDVQKRKEEMKDLGPQPLPKPISPSSLDDLIREVKELKDEVEKIKKALKNRGIPL